jgi:hypothetical protein
VKDPEQQELLESRIRKWFETEGYPLEFRTAHAFTEAGFESNQGMYTYDPKEGRAREIDVRADVITEISSNRWLRVSHIVECKWSMDKPWVLFTSSGNTMGVSAQIAQTIGSCLGEAITYCLASDARIKALPLFEAPQRGGFGGRRALEKSKDSQDRVYAAIQSVVSKALLEGERYDEQRQPGELPWFGAVCLPMIVLQGKLFEAYYDNKASEVRLLSVENVRLYWRAAASKLRSIAVVDVVAESALGSFLKSRRSDVAEFMGAAAETGRRIERAFQSTSMEPLEIQPVARGFLGLPQLLAELRTLAGPRKP